MRILENKKKISLTFILIVAILSSGCLDAIEETLDDAMELFEDLEHQISSKDVDSKDVSDMDKVLVTSVVDGDTIDILFKNGKEDRVRMVGVDTPESYGSNDISKWEGIEDTEILDMWGKEAKELTTEMLLDEYVYLDYDSIAGERGYYGRLLAYVYLSDGTNYNAYLIEEGYARLYTGNSCEYYDEFYELEVEARDGGKGLWAYSSYGSKEGVFIQTINAYQEYIVIVNGTDNIASFDGWYFVDNSGVRFDFPDDFALAPHDSVTIYTQSGNDSSEILYWNKTTNIWNNDGDMATLYNHKDAIVDSFYY